MTAGRSQSDTLRKMRVSTTSLWSRSRAPENTGHIHVVATVSIIYGIGLSCFRSEELSPSCCETSLPAYLLLHTRFRPRTGLLAALQRTRTLKSDRELVHHRTRACGTELHPAGYTGSGSQFSAEPIDIEFQGRQDARINPMWCGFVSGCSSATELVKILSLLRWFTTYC